MTKTLKAVLIGLGLMISVPFLVEFIFNPSNWLSILVGVVVGGITAAVLIARNRGEKPIEVVREVAEQVVAEVVQPEPDADKKRALEQLVTLNQKVRMSVRSSLVLEASEQLIDLLLEVVPRALDESPGSEATFDLMKLSSEYLGDLLGNFAELSSNDQQAQENDLVNQLSDLFETARSAEESLDSGTLHEFKVSSSFLKLKTA